MTNLQLKISSTDLASRANAAQFRNEILNCIRSYGVVEMDLGEVQCVSDSFADELFGVLAVKIGIDELVTKVKVLNAKDSVYRTIAINIRNRLKQKTAN
jgi:hypothetical protein